LWGAKRGLISGGWRLFVEMDSYAIALLQLGPLGFTAELIWVEKGNSMGLSLEARSPFPRPNLCLGLETLFRKLFLEANVERLQAAGSNWPGS